MVGYCCFTAHFVVNGWVLLLYGALCSKWLGNVMNQDAHEAYSMRQIQNKWADDGKKCIGCHSIM
jgi:hypothetical protein